MTLIEIPKYPKPKTEIIPITIMPAKSAKQQRYMGMVAHMKNPPKGAPSKKVAREFSHKPKGGYKQRDRRDVKFY